LCFT
jgi:hypothetical protein